MPPGIIPPSFSAIVHSVRDAAALAGRPYRRNRAEGMGLRAFALNGLEQPRNALSGAPPKYLSAVEPIKLDRGAAEDLACGILADGVDHRHHRIPAIAVGALIMRIVASPHQP